MREKHKRKRAKAMLPEIKLLITKRALNERGKLREELADELIPAIKKLFPQETPPAWETIIKLISKTRNESHPLDNPWHFGLLREHPEIAGEAVRHILETQKAMRSLFERLPVNPNDYHLTVRQAFWVARLYDVVAKQIETDDFYKEHWPDIKPDDPHVLFSVSSHYADYELLCDLAGISCDTSELDAALSGGIRQFFTFYNEQNRPSIKDHSILDPEGHKQPHKMANWRFVFDPDCQLCKSQEASGTLYDLRMGLTRKGVFKRQKAKLSSEKKEAQK